MFSCTNSSINATKYFVNKISLHKFIKFYQIVLFFLSLAKGEAIKKLDSEFNCSDNQIIISRDKERQTETEAIGVERGELR